MNAELETQQPVYIDGIPYDPETGECLQSQAFQIDSDERADWYLEKLLNAEADLAREEIKLRAITETQGAKVKDAQRRVDSLRRRFDNELTEYAKTKLDGKGKTVKFSFGSVAFRTVKGGLRVKDADKALAMAQSAFPEAIKVSKSFQISLLSPDSRDHIIDRCTLDYGDAFEVKPDEERVDVKVGVTK